jgi:acetyl esterase/lipase
VIDRRTFLTGLAAALAPPAALSAPRDLVTIDYGPAKLDIYPTQSSSQLPVMIYVHGGAWQIGRRTEVGAKPAFFRTLGYLFVSIDYRLAPFAKPDRQAGDVAAAYQWVRENIAAHGGDQTRIVMMGHSAGSHLAALAALSGKLPGLHGLICNDIQMYDIEKFAAMNGGHLPRHYGYLFGAGDRWDALSPANYIGQHPMPPVLVCHSNMALSAELSLDFAERLKSAGVRVLVFDGRQYRHKDINRRIGLATGGISAAVADYLAALG